MYQLRSEAPGPFVHHGSDFVVMVAFLNKFSTDQAGAAAPQEAFDGIIGSLDFCEWLPGPLEWIQHRWKWPKLAPEYVQFCAKANFHADAA